MNKLRVLFSVVLGILLLSVGGWLFLSGGPSQTALAEVALSNAVSLERQQAALKLTSLDNSSGTLQQVFEQSQDPAVRAICLQGIGDARHYDAMPLVLMALEDEHPAVRASASGAVARLLHCKNRIPAEGDVAQRTAAIGEVRRRWDTLVRHDLVEELPQATGMRFYYDQQAEEIFVAPSHLPNLLPLPAGPFRGMPAAVHARVFAVGNCDSSTRFVGWLMAAESELAEAGVKLPSVGPPGDSPHMLVRQTDDPRWIYIGSDEAQDLFARIYALDGNNQVTPCLP